MYSPLIVDRRLHQAAKQGLKYKRLPREDSIDISTRLERLRTGKHGKPLPDGQLIRPLLPAEEQFIESERLLCKLDFEYWFTRYCQIRLDPGVTDSAEKIGPPVLLESQRRYIVMLGRREEECFEEKKKYNFTVGTVALFHKVRQVAATATARAATIHRMLWWPGTRALAASLDDVRIGELFERDHLIVDRLPFWQMPRLYPDVKDTELGFSSPVDSLISYQAENQQQGRGGLGVGKQLDVGHLTEVALYQYPGFIKFSFMPSLPKAITTLLIMESTAKGKGNYWHEITEAARHKRRGYEHMVYVFIPWYMNKLKYRDNPPADWVPQDHTIRHAVLIERTSPEFFDGRTVEVSREQLYWWETERENHIRSGQLNTFLTNYPATPEQSFQSFSDSALPADVLERLEQRVEMPGECYEVECAA